MGDPNITSTCRTNYTDITSTTSSTSSYIIVYKDTDTYININYSISINEIEKVKLLKKLLRKQILDKMIEGWTEQIQYVSQPPMKPISLRGVCFNGRGWA